MEFELINKAHKEINEIKKRDKAVALITVERKSFYFTAEAVKTFKMNGDDKYVHFGRGKDEKGKANGLWYFIVNKVNTGFKVTTSISGGARINSMPLVRLFCQSGKAKIGASFFLQKTDHVSQGSSVIEILTHKSTKELKRGG